VDPLCHPKNLPITAVDDSRSTISIRCSYTVFESLVELVEKQLADACRMVERLHSLQDSEMVYEQRTEMVLLLASTAVMGRFFDDKEDPFIVGSPLDCSHHLVERSF
jgi:hypothetical protein